MEKLEHEMETTIQVGFRFSGCMGSPVRVYFLNPEP